MPIFYEGELIAFAANKAHWTEVGGMAPGSWTTDSTEIFQEGLQFPCIKAFVNDEPLPQIVDLIRVNVRTPDMSLGDFYAQAASLRLAGRRIVEICGKYGVGAVKEAMAWLLEDGRQRAKAALARLPKGTFVAEDTIDDDGISDNPIPVRVEVTITDDEFVVDFSQMPPQVAGPINSSRTGTFSALRCAWIAIASPQSQINEGIFDPVRLVVPDGTIITASATSAHLDLLGDTPLLVGSDLEGPSPGCPRAAAGGSLQHRGRLNHHDLPRGERPLHDPGRAQHGRLGRLRRPGWREWAIQQHEWRDL